MNRAERRAAWLNRHRGQQPDASPVPGIPAGASVDLRIGEIVLHGLPRLARHDLADSVRTELTRLIRTTGLPPPLRTGGRTDRLRAEPIRIARGSSAAVLGQQIAGAVLGQQTAGAALGGRGR